MKGLAICVLLFSAAATGHAERVAVVGAKIFDGSGSAAYMGSIVWSGERIDAVGPSIAIPPDARRIEGAGLTVLPGLFDIHTHLLASAGRAPADWGKNLKSYLLSGVTTVVDLSTYPEQFEPMRRLLSDGGMAGPHVLMASRFSTPGGHGAEAGRGDFHTQLVQTPEEARASVRKMLAYRPDVIKVFSDGWRYGNAIDMSSMEEPTLAALVDEAHKGGVKVLTHTVTLEKAKIAARAGVDVMIHGISNAPLDDETLALMKKKGTGYAETLSVYEPRAGRDLSSPLLPVVLDAPLRAELDVDTGKRAEKNPRWDNLVINAKKYRDSGMRMALGTDAGMPGTYHGWATLHELELLVQTGLTPLEALATGTSASAKALGLEGDRGTLAVGKRADVLLVAGDPTAKIGDIYQVRQVFRDGREVDLAGLKKAVSSYEITPMTALRAVEKLDDFEQSRSLVDTLWINNTDSGHDHSEMSYQRTKRVDGGSALTVLCKAAQKKAPMCSMVLPLAKGSVEPVDATPFTGVEFEVRGEGAYEVRMASRSSGRRALQADFTGAPQWKRVRVPFGGFNAVDLLQLEFLIAREAGSEGWMELDNVRFYK